MLSTLRDLRVSSILAKKEGERLNCRLSNLGWLQCHLGAGFHWGSFGFVAFYVPCLLENDQTNPFRLFYSTCGPCTL